MPADVTEQLAVWFFRLNGCFTIPSFLLHRLEGGGQQAEFDLLAVRFPYRTELLNSPEPMSDHVFFDGAVSPHVFIVEVANGRCKLNEIWRKQEKNKVTDLLHAIGAIPPTHAREAVDALVQNYRYDGASCTIRIVAIGSKRDRAPRFEQLTWQEVLAFIGNRMVEYYRAKADHRQWDDLGQELYKAAIATSADGVKSFVQYWMDRMQTRRSRSGSLADASG